MKTIFSNFFALAITSIVFAQKPDLALIRVKYSFSHMIDTNKNQYFYTETMLLVIGKNASVFLSYDNIIRDIEAKKYFEEQIKQQGGTITSLKAPPRKRQYSNTKQYYFANEGKLFTEEMFGTTYITEQIPEKIDWRITQETLVIDGIKCKKATAFFKGRNWTAWFAEELPFNSGPWKLVGLPGLIVQAHDEKKEVMFDFAGLAKVENQNSNTQNSLDEFKLEKLGSSDFLTSNEIKLPTNAVKATVKEMERLKEARTKDPEGFAKAQLAAMGLGGLTKISSGPAKPTNTQTQLPVFNNPIEKIIHNK